MEHVIEKLRMEEEREGEISRRVANAIEDLEKVEESSESVEDKIREVLESLDEKEEKTQKKSTIVFSSIEEIEKAIHQHPHVQKQFSIENYEKCEQYIRVISEEEDVSIEEIAEKERLDEQVVESWKEGTKPKPVFAIEGHETKRLEHESQVPGEALRHRISPKDVYEVTSDALERTDLSVKELTDIVQDIHSEIDNPKRGTIYYAELYNSEKHLVNDKLRDFAFEIRSL